VVHNLSGEVSPLELRFQESPLRILFFLLKFNHCFLHLLQPIHHIFIPNASLPSLLCKYLLQLALSHSHLCCVGLHESPKLRFELVDPLGGEQVLERRVVDGIGDVGEGVEGKELGGFGEVLPLCV